MEDEYNATCDNCDVETHVLVIDESEVPCYCPMCGSNIEYEILDKD